MAQICLESPGWCIIEIVGAATGTAISRSRNNHIFSPSGSPLPRIGEFTPTTRDPSVVRAWNEAHLVRLDRHDHIFHRPRESG